MKQTYLVIVALIMAAACQSPKEKALARIKGLESNDSVFSNELMLNLRKEYVEFSNAYPDDEHTPEFMLKAGQRSIVLEQPEEAVELFHNIIIRYPKSASAESALFLSAYTFENSLNDTTGARKYYTEFLQKYPKGELANDARIAIENLGKTPEEIVAGMGED